jgi:hypothetical protein
MPGFTVTQCCAECETRLGTAPTNVDFESSSNKCKCYSPKLVRHVWLHCLTTHDCIVSQGEVEVTRERNGRDAAWCVDPFA